MAMQQELMEIGDTFEFGKHEGCEVREVIEGDPEYLAYLYGENEFIFDDDLIGELECLDII